jgi:polysaccharide biosynthesis protein PslA
MTLYDNALAGAEHVRSVLSAHHNGLTLHLPTSSIAVDTPPVATSVAKRAMDIVLALIGLLTLLPVLVAVALVIKIESRGPVFFTQEREGLDGRLFRILKFRTMRVDRCDGAGLLQAVDDDPRATRFGRFLRRTSIDELPQLINVLLGQMSLVGPRPHVPGMLAAGMPYAELFPYYADRHAAKPGLTGWAQANGLRGPTTSHALSAARLHHDLAYIQNWSLVLDCRILLLTVWRLFA